MKHIYKNQQQSIQKRRDNTKANKELKKMITKNTQFYTSTQQINWQINQLECVDIGY